MAAFESTELAFDTFGVAGCSIVTSSLKVAAPLPLPAAVPVAAAAAVAAAVAADIGGGGAGGNGGNKDSDAHKFVLDAAVKR